MPKKTNERTLMLEQPDTVALVDILDVGIVRIELRPDGVEIQTKLDVSDYEWREDYHFVPLPERDDADPSEEDDDG